MGCWIGEREVMKDAWVEVAAGLFFTTSSVFGLLSGAQQEYHTPCLLIHISHIPVWIKRGGRWKREAKTSRRRGGFDTDEQASAVEREWGWHAVRGNTYCNSTKRTSNQAQNWHTSWQTGDMISQSVCMYSMCPCVPIQRSYLEVYVSYSCGCVQLLSCAYILVGRVPHRPTTLGKWGLETGHIPSRMRSLIHR